MWGIFLRFDRLIYYESASNILHFHGTGVQQFLSSLVYMYTLMF